MKPLVSFKILLISVLALLLPAGLTAQGLASPVPFDPLTRVGKLPNGMTYYVRKNTEPRKRAFLMLAVKVGAIQEEDPENGLAHFTEHMGFNGTKNFPKNELVSFLQSNGIKFGDDLNAFTSFDRTIYMLPVPTDSAGVFRRAFDVLEDWAHNMTMDPAEIEKERGVILEELRGGKGAQQRMRDRYFPIIMNGAKWGRRNVIGTEDILKNFKPETIQNFYKTWYRPDNQAIIAVGDFDPDAVETMIRQQFGSLPMPANPKPIGSYPIDDNADTKLAIVTDPEQPYTIVQVMGRQPRLREKSLSDTREKMKRSLFNTMFANRLQELTKQANPPFQFGGGGIGGFLGDYDAFNSFVVARQGKLQEGVRAVLDENARALKYGFTATELERAKQQLLTATEKRFKEKDKTNSQALAFEYATHFVDTTPSMGISAYYDFVKSQLPGISLEEVNEVPRKVISDRNRAVIVMAPEKDKASLPTEAQLLDWINNGGKDVKPYVDEVVKGDILKTLPTGRPARAEKALTDIGATELTLANGMKVVLKPTDFKNDEILFTGYSFGGTSLYSDADFYNADYSNLLAVQGGLGDFSSVQLKKYLTGRVVSVSPYVNELTEGISGSMSPKDVETGLQMIHAYFTAPRRDAEVVKGFLANLKDDLEQGRRTPDPQQVFSDSVSAFMGGYARRRMPVQPEDVDKIDLDKSLGFYRDRFANAADFTFFFVGNFDAATLKPLLEKYLGSLPATAKKETFRDLNLNPPRGQVSKTFYRGVDDKAMAQLIYSGTMPYSEDNATNLSALEEILNIRLIEDIREKESGVYYIYAQSGLSKLPKPTYTLTIGYGTNPGRVNELADKTQAILDDIRKNGPGQKELDKFKVETKRQLEVQMRENRFWLNALNQAYQRNENPAGMLSEVRRINAVTVASVRAMAQRVMGPNRAKLVLMPEKPKAAAGSTAPSGR